MISACFQGKPFSITEIQVYALTTNSEELKLNGPMKTYKTFLELINTQKRCPFHYKGLECKSRNSRNTWSKGKFGLGVRNEAGQRLIEFCQERALVIANTPSKTLHMDITRQLTPKSD